RGHNLAYNLGYYYTLFYITSSSPLLSSSPAAKLNVNPPPPVPACSTSSSHFPLTFPFGSSILFSSFSASSSICGYSSSILRTNNPYGSFTSSQSKPLTLCG